MFKFISVLLISIFLYGCKQQDQENPFAIARKYCNCVEQQMRANKDSLIDLNYCGRIVFSTSRLMQIKFQFDADPLSALKQYSDSTLDSAKQLTDEVRMIQDTMCFLKFDQRKVKKFPHAF